MWDMEYLFRNVTFFDFFVTYENVFFLIPDQNTYHLQTYINTHHSCFIPEWAAETSQIFLRDVHVLPK
jgi:hypothetical protein